MYVYVIPASFALCGGLFLVSVWLTGAPVETSCSRVSFFHHFVAMCLGLYAHWEYRDRVDDDASFGPNHEFPVAVVLQHFNIGYFLYDTIHVIVWDQKFLLHHIIAIAGYGTSELAGVFALANAVNTWITEVGSLMYSAYLIIKSDSAYLAFVVLYTASRLYFAFWSVQVFRHVWRELYPAASMAVKYPVWAPYDAAALQILLLGVNVTFVATHWQKLVKRYMGGQGKRKD